MFVRRATTNLLNFRSLNRNFASTASKFATVKHSEVNLVKSHVHGASEYPLITKTIGECLEDTTSEHGHRDAVIIPYQNIRYTYADLLEMSQKFAAGLLQMGVQRGDRVGIWSTNNIEWIITQYATALIGAVLVNVNPAYRPQELKYALNKVQCKVLILEERFRQQDNVEVVNSLAPELQWFREAPKDGHTFAELPYLTHLVNIGRKRRNGMHKFTDVLGNGALAGQSGIEEIKSIGQYLTVDDAINIQFTSGTTGSPKGAALTHFNILNNGHLVGQGLRYTEEDRVCIPVPLYHCFGMVLGSLNCMSHGAAMVFPSASFSPEATIKALVEEKCTSLYGVPTMFISVLESPDLKGVFLPAKRDHEAKTGTKWPLRTGVMSGAPCPIEVMRRVMDPEQGLGAGDVSVACGMTEVSPIAVMTSVDDPIQQRVGSVGRVMPHSEVKVINSETGATLPVGQTGEILYRGYNVMLGYWDGDGVDEAVTRGKPGSWNIDSARWMHSGDLGVMDEKGYLSVVGRNKDMIIRGGENIYPREIEEVLYTHPAIEDAHVIGVPDPKYGEQVAVWVKLRQHAALDAEGVKAHCQATLARFKVPKYVKFVDSFPMTISGKIQKFVMRDQMAKELAEEQAAMASLDQSTSSQMIPERLRQPAKPKA